ncbi:MAG: Npt1/Npt2 family nucleotide transporter [Bryobacterales bacterium]|nr:Npt1/Npt2 family nucleotide transporter [Bryobacterales bacterium]
MDDSPRKTSLDRFLSLFTRVKPGEASGALLLASNVFLLLASYYILKTVREPLILAEGSAELKAYAAAAQAALLFIVIPVYGWIASRMERMKFISVSTLFFVANLAGFYLLVNSGAKVGFAFFIWLGIFNNFVVAQFWAFSNDLYTEEQGKRLFPIIGVGTALGAWLGSVFAGELFAEFQVGGMMLLAGLGLLLSLVVTWVVNWRFRRRTNAANEGDQSDEPLAKDGGFELILRSRYLMLIAILIFLLNVVNTTGEYILSSFVTGQAQALYGAADSARGEVGIFIGEFYGSFFGWVNLITLLLQLLVVPYLFRWIGVRGALFILPCIALGGYSLLIAFPMLAVIRVAKILENATDYLVQNTTRHALFLLTSREAKYKAKAAIDTFVVRTGDMLQAGIVKLGTTVGLSVKGFAAINLGLVGVWLFVVFLLYKEHKKLERQKELEERAAA